MSIITNLGIVTGVGMIAGGMIWGLVKTRGDKKLSKEEYTSSVFSLTVPGLIIFTISMYFLIRDSLSEVTSIMLLSAASVVSIAYSVLVIGFCESRMRLATVN